MKFLTISFMTSILLILQVSCHRKIPEEDIQEERALGVDDIRESDSYERKIPLEKNGHGNRDVLENNEVEIDD